MSRNKDKITKALNKKGYTIAEIYWEPIGSAPIMCGNSGGWYVETNEYIETQYGFILAGYNVNEILEQIEELSQYKGE